MVNAPERGFERLLSLPSQSFFLLGPRGVGKSTWAVQKLPEAERFDLLDEALFQDLLAAPGLFGAQLAEIEPGSWVIVDEVQRVPALLNEVHRQIEERGLRFALLGSSARKLKTLGTNLLAGRALRKVMHPLAPEELGEAFSLERALAEGTIALVWQSPDARATLESYVQLYLKEEIRGEALVRNLPGFVRFLPVAALFHGQVINVSGIAREAGVSRTTVNGYLEILEDTLIANRLPAFEARLRLRERKHPKLYWIDPGVVRAVKRQHGPVAIEERGPLLEGLVYNLLRLYAEEDELYDELTYWAPVQARTVEVDFVLRRGKEILAIEVKTGSRFSTRMTTGLEAIGELPQIVRRIVVYGGRTSLRTPDGIEAWPTERLLEALAADELWP
jgi:predicted AAA+ superfamily ATPase